jgi:hypothetical protein
VNTLKKPSYVESDDGLITEKNFEYIFKISEKQESIKNILEKNNSFVCLSFFIDFLKDEDSFIKKNKKYFDKSTILSKEDYKNFFLKKCQPLIWCQMENESDKNIKKILKKYIEKDFEKKIKF